MFSKNEQYILLNQALNEIEISLNTLLSETNPSFKSKLLNIYYSKIINGLKEILKSDDENIIKELDKFLAKNWELVNGKYLSYTRLHNEFTLLLCLVAYFIEANDKSSSKRCALQILMPTVSIVSYSDAYKDLDTLDLEYVLENHILSRDGKYLIPVQQLLEYREKNKKVNNYYYSYEDPADYAYLTDEEYQRLIDHSSYSKAIIETKNLYEATKKAQGSLLAHLEHLIEQLYFNSVAGKGTEFNAGEAVYNLIFNFNTYYTQLDGEIINKIPTNVKNEIDELLAFVSDIDKNYNKDTKEVNPATCINTIRVKLEYVVKNESCILETLGLSQEKMATILEEQRKVWKDAENDFLIAHSKYKLEGFDNLPITVQLIEALEIDITIRDKEELHDLIQAMPAEQLEILFTKRLDLRQQLVEIWDDLEDFRGLFIAQIPHDKAKVIFLTCGNEIKTELIKNYMDIVCLLDWLDLELTQILCDTFLTDFPTLKFIFEQVDKITLPYVMNAIQNRMPKLIANASNFYKLMENIKIDSPEHKFIFESMKADLPVMIKDFSDFYYVLKYINAEEREIIFGQKETTLSKLPIYNVSHFGWLFSDVLTSAQYSIVFNAKKDSLSSLIKNITNFESILECLLPPQREEIANQILDNLPQMINTAGEFEQTFKLLTPAQRSVVFNKKQEDITKYINTPRNFNQILKYLSNENRDCVFNKMLKNISGLIKNNSNHLILILKFLSDAQTTLVLKELNLLPFSTAGEQRKISKEISATQYALFCEALKTQGPSLRDCSNIIFLSNDRKQNDKNAVKSFNFEFNKY